MRKRYNSGVTLVELAIVIVIIGVLVGVVLAGAQLIKQAKIDAGIAQIDKYRVAIATFQVKYNALPGDFKKATKFWPDCVYDGHPNDCNGDGNGMWDGAYEYFFTFHHLELAGLVDGHYDPPTTYAPLLKTTQQSITPSIQTDPNNIFFQFPVNVNSFIFVVAKTVDEFTHLDTNQQKIVDPETVWAFDVKLDDGNGKTGGLRTMYDPSAPPDTPFCTDANGNYQLSGANSPLGICDFILRY